MAMAQRALPKPKELVGHANPRLAPPIPAKSDAVGFRDDSIGMGITLMPWQETAGRYLTARAPSGRLLYREVCILVARQNGKTTLMKPLIVRALRAGKRVMHIAQNRELPRHMFGIIADALSDEEDLFPKRRGRTIWPRYGSGQEEIVLANGGAYRIAAASRGGARGHPNDLLILDELREMETFDVIGAAEPTLTMSEDPQTVYLSNEGTETSVVLNSIRDRAGEDETLAFLSWSADPQRAPDDREGWLESNPAIGHYPSVLRTLEAAYRRHKLAGTMAIFETEHLCRRVITMAPRLFSDQKWQDGQSELARASRPFMAISMDPGGTRASAAIAWRVGDTVSCRVEADVTGDPVTGAPIDVDLLGPQLMKRAIRMGVRTVGYDDSTDRDLARYFKNSKAVIGKEYANGSAKFISLVEEGKLRWSDADPITEDLAFAATREYDTAGARVVVKAKEDRPVTALLAAIRAVWLASAPQPTAPRIR